MKQLILAAFVIAETVLAQQPKAAPEAKAGTLLTRNLADIPGKEAALLAVEFPPGAEGTVHRHNAHVIVYVLEGSVVMGVRGGKEVTLGPGSTFYEAPGDVHTVSRNASKTQPAKFLAFFVKDQGAPISVPVK